MSARRFLVVCAIVPVLVAAEAREAGADAHGKTRALNIGVQAGLTVASAAIQGKVRGVRDVVRCLVAGSASGWGVYEAKVLVGKGRVKTGWVVANLAGSLSENAAAGRNPLGQLGYSIGPVRVRVPVPRLDRDAAAHVLVDVYAYEAVSLAIAVAWNDRVEWRDGLIGFRRDTLYDDGAVGAASGIFPGVADDHPVTWRHEVIHAVQALQLDVPEPALSWRYLTLSKPAPAGAGRKAIRFEHIKIGMFNFGNELWLSLTPYEDHWSEREAYRLTESPFSAR